MASRVTPEDTKNPDVEISGPSRLFNPTRRLRPIYSIFQAKEALFGSPQASSTPQIPSSIEHHSTRERTFSNAHHLWRSRDNRKGRHAIVMSEPRSDGKYTGPLPTNSFRPVLNTIWKMITYYPFWDVSWLVAQWFTWGSIVWCLNAFFVWLPTVRPSSEFHGEAENAGGITAFLGATIFEIGSVFLMIEAVNENRSECFGWAFEEVVEEKGLVRLLPDRDNCKHHHRNKMNLVGRGWVDGGRKGKDSKALDVEVKERRQPSKREEELKGWIWWPSWHDLRTHYFREIGFLACLAQFVGATIFWIAGFTALPSIQKALSTPGINGAYWAPQVIGGCGFIISSSLFCIETQERWWKPAPRVLGWHIGFWNLVGAWGFTLSGVFGFWTTSKGTYQAGLSTFWGGWAFLIGSVIQWYESLQKYPVEVEKRDEMVPTRTTDAVNGEHQLHTTETYPV